MYCNHFYHGTESVLIIDVVALLEAFCNQYCLIAINLIIYILLDLVYLFAVNHILSLICRYKVLGFVLLKSKKLFIHGEGPEKATRGGGVNERQSKFLIGTLPISRNQPDAPLF
jgi:hypothetical protein